MNNLYGSLCATMYIVCQSVLLYYMWQSLWKSTKGSICILKRFTIKLYICGRKFLLVWLEHKYNKADLKNYIQLSLGKLTLHI